MKTLAARFLIDMFIACVVATGLVLAPTIAAAQDEDNFYEGKTISVVIRSTAGGGYDFYGRLIARHLGQYIPGHPEVIAVNRPGAGGLVAANYMYNRAPKDGTEILIAAREIALSERLGSAGVRYETLKMPPIGNASSATRVWLAGPDVPVDNLEDLANFDRDFRFAVSGKGAGSYQMVSLLQQAGYPVEIITGYEGTSSQVLAVLRGEADGSNHGYGSAHDVIENEGMKVIAKLGNNPAVADVEDVRDVLTGKYRALAKVLAAPLVAGRPFFTAPGTPPDRLAILREAFRKAVQDPQVQAEAKRADRPIGYSSPEEMTEVYKEIMNAPDDVVETFREE